MAIENEDLIDIEVPDDAGAPKPDDVIVETALQPEGKVPAQKAGSPDEEIENLKASVEREKQRAADAERRANEATNIAVQATNGKAESDLSLVANAIGSLNQTQAVLKGNLSAAMQAGDFDGAADIQAEMAKNAATIQTLETGKNNLEAAPKAQAPQPIGDPVEATAAQVARNGAPRSADSIRAHPDYVRDARLNRMMVAAHELAVGQGKQVDSDSYFEAVETTLGLRNAVTDADALSGAAAPVQRRSAPPAAPVSRSGTGDGRNANRVTLSAEEREIAANLNMTDQEYGRAKLDLIKEGQLTKH